MKQTLDVYMALHYPAKLIQRDDGNYFATHPDLQGCMAEGHSADEAMNNLRASRKAWIETRLSGGYSVPEPAAEEEYSGKLLLRMSPRLHAGLSEAAANENVSLNQLINGVLSEYLGEARLYGKFSDRLQQMQESIRSELSCGTPNMQAVRRGGWNARGTPAAHGPGSPPGRRAGKPGPPRRG